MAVPESDEIRAGVTVGPMTGVRWTICALLFFATTINYLDRQLFSLLVPFFEDELRIGPTDLALINVSFLLAYGFGMVFVGRFIDRVGVKKGLSATFLAWNLASVGHACVASLAGFVGARFLLGLGEAGNFPASVRTVTEWFPKRERALATGWFNSGSNLGAILAPLLAVMVAQTVGWRACFVILGGIGAVWIFFWIRLYRRPEEHAGVSPSEFALIREDGNSPRQELSFWQVFAMRPVYGVSIAKFFTDAPWWFYLTWLPKFLTDQFHLKPIFMAWALPVVFLAADGGAVGGGWLSSRLIARGAGVGRARKTAMAICAACALPVAAVGGLADLPKVLGIPSIYLALLLLALAAAAHQGWSSNLYTLVSDTQSKEAVSMAVGVMTMFGVVGGAAFQLFVGRSVQLTGSYVLPFALAGSLYFVGLLALQIVLPKIEPISAPAKGADPVLVVAGGFALLALLGALQFSLSQPPYANLADYEAARAKELEAVVPPEAGDTAKVGWMSAQWFLWRPAGKPAKPELVKFDRENRPVIEPKGALATKYKGPDLSKVNADFGAAKP